MDVNGVVSCVDKNLTQCTISTNEYPFRCLQCEQDYYPNKNGLCERAMPISNCLVSDSNQTCARCSQGYVRSANKTSCDPLDFARPFDNSCSFLEIKTNPFCIQCKPGFFFSDLECVSCQNATTNKGCLQCDSSSLLACLICQPGFYQNSTGFCIQTELNDSSSAIGSQENCIGVFLSPLFIVMIIVLS